MRLSALPAKNTDARDACDDGIIERGGMQMNGAFRVEGIAVMEGKRDSCVMNRPPDSMRHIILHAMPSTCTPLMIACRSE